MQRTFKLTEEAWEFMSNLIREEANGYLKKNFPEKEVKNLSNSKFWVGSSLVDCKDQSSCEDCSDKCQNSSFLHLMKLKHNENISLISDEDILNIRANYYYKLYTQVKKGSKSVEHDKFDILYKFLGYSDYSKFSSCNKNTPFVKQIRVSKESNLSIITTLPSGKTVTEDELVILNMQRLSYLKNTTWAFFHYNYYERYKKQITQLLLSFNDFTIGEPIILKTLDKDTEFDGSIDFKESTDNYVILNVFTELKSKYLQLRFLTPSDKKLNNPIYLGQYIDIDNGIKLITGTFIVQKVSKAKAITLQIKNYTIGSKEANGVIDKSIQNYFAYKWHNFNKITSGIYTIEELANWKYENHKKSEDYPTDIIINSYKEYDAFISAPIHSVSNKKFKEIKSQINLFIDSFDDELADLGIDKNKVFYAPKNLSIEDHKHTRNPRALLKTELELIKQSKYFILYIPDSITKLAAPSSAFLVAGYAISYQIPVFIFCNNEKQLPFLLRETSEKMVKIYKPHKKLKTNEEMLSWLKENLPPQ